MEGVSSTEISEISDETVTREVSASRSRVLKSIDSLTESTIVLVLWGAFLFSRFRGPFHQVLFSAFRKVTTQKRTPLCREMRISSCFLLFLSVWANKTWSDFVFHDSIDETIASFCS